MKQQQFSVLAAGLVAASAFSGVAQAECLSDVQAAAMVPNYLDDETDRKVLVEGMRLVRKIMAQPKGSPSLWRPSDGPCLPDRLRA